MKNIIFIIGKIENFPCNCFTHWCFIPVSYTHLDVYKRQGKDSYVASLARTKEEEETDSYSIHVYYANETIKVTTKEKQ